MKFSEIAYKRPDLDNISKSVQEMSDKMSTATDFKTQEELILQNEQLVKEIMNCQMLATVRHNQNTTDNFYKEEVIYFGQNLPKTGNAFKAFSDQVIASPFHKEINARFGKHLLSSMELSKKLNNPAAEEEQVQIAQLVNEYMQGLSQVTCNWDGKEVPLNALQVPLQSTDRAIRIEAQEIRTKALSSFYTKAANIFHQQVGFRFKMAEKLAFDSPIDLFYLRMKRFDYTPQDVAKLREHLRNRLLPIQKRLQAEKKERLGLDTIKCYDSRINFLDGNPQLQVKGQDLMDTAETMYAELSPTVHGFFKKMRELEMFDFEPRVNKSPGGFSAPLPLEFSSFIFGSFTGTTYDLSLLTHELGHAFQFYMSADVSKEIMDYRYPSLETAEIHSTAMEYFTWDWYVKFLGEDAKKFKYQKLCGIPSYLLDICMIDHFQETIYSNPEHTIEERNAAYRSLELSYFPYRTDEYWDHQAFHVDGKSWMSITHIFHRPFYMIDYAIALICALQFWKRSRSDFDAAWADYIKLCKIGGSVPFAEAIKMANLKSPFEKETIDEVIDFMEEGIAYLKE